MNFMKQTKALLASLDKCSVYDPYIPIYYNHYVLKGNIHIPKHCITLDKLNKHEIQQTQQSWRI